MHVSGHASAGELLYCYNLLKPRNVLPIHGEVRHLIANAKLAVATGVPEKRALVVEDGAVIDLAKGRARVVGQLDCGYIFVDGLTEGEIGDTELTDRKILGEEGFISVVAVVNFHANTLVSGPDIHARGFAEDDSVLDVYKRQVFGVAATRVSPPSVSWGIPICIFARVLPMGPVQHGQRAEA